MGVQEEPIDPFNGDPADPAAGLDDLNEDAEIEPLTEDERQDVLEDLSDLEIYQALLSPTGIRGLVIECEDCHEPHYFDWDLLRGNLRHLLSSGPAPGARAGLRPRPGPLRHLGIRPRLRRRRARHPDRGHATRTRPTRLWHRNGAGAHRLPRTDLSNAVVQATSPARKPAATACARSRAPSLRNSRRAWVLTVSSETNSSRPISALLLPSAIPRSTCSSRSVSVSRRPAGARVGHHAPASLPGQATIGRPVAGSIGCVTALRRHHRRVRPEHGRHGRRVRRPPCRPVAVRPAGRR